MRREMAAGDAIAAAEHNFQGAGLYYLNGRLAGYAQENYMLAWTFLFHGVYQAAVEVLEVTANTEYKPPSIENVGQGMMAADLFCQNGRFVIAGMDELGRPSENIVVVEPGLYRVTFTRNDAMEAKHGFLEDVTEYPAEDAADWTITIQPVQATS